MVLNITTYTTYYYKKKLCAPLFVQEPGGGKIGNYPNNKL